jgi:Rrf2 family protein
MLLTRRACYGLIAAQHLAEHAGEGSFSAHDLAECYGLPHEALAKVLQRLSTAGVLMSHHGIKGGYTLARDPRYISVFDVIEASERPREAVCAAANAGGTSSPFPATINCGWCTRSSQICCVSLRLKTATVYVRRLEEIHMSTTTTAPTTPTKEAPLA